MIEKINFLLPNNSIIVVAFNYLLAQLTILGDVNTLPNILFIIKQILIDLDISISDSDKERLLLKASPSRNTKATFTMDFNLDKPPKFSYITARLVVVAYSPTHYIQPNPELKSDEFELMFEAPPIRYTMAIEDSSFVYRITIINSISQHILANVLAKYSPMSISKLGYLLDVYPYENVDTLTLRNLNTNDVFDIPAKNLKDYIWEGWLYEFSSPCVIEILKTKPDVLYSIRYSLTLKDYLLKYIQESWLYIKIMFFRLVNHIY